MNQISNADLKVSRYIVASAPVAKDKYVVLYSTRNTTMRLVPKDVYEQLRNGRLSAIDGEKIRQLVSEGFLVPHSENELHTIIAENKRAIAADRTLYMAIAPSADCQLGCDYCGQAHTKDKMGESEHRSIVQRVKSKLESKPRSHLEIGWFGGEPLTGLKSIYALSKELRSLADKNGCTYGATMVTNGVALRPEIFFRLAQECEIRDFEVTIDGPQEFHDSRRHTKSGQATYSIIMDNLSDILNDARFDAGPASITLRCNVDSRNYAGVRRLIDDLDKAGMLKKIKFYVAPIHSWGNDAHEKTLLKSIYSDFEMDIFSYLWKKGHGIAVLPTKKKNIVCMSLKSDSELIDAYGDIYNCSEVSQVPAYKKVKLYRMGELVDHGSHSEIKRPFSDWNDKILSGDVPCHHCEILPICGGACPKLWTEGISPCPPIKENISQRLILELVRTSKVSKEKGN